MLAVVVLLVVLPGCTRAGGEPFQPTHNEVIPLTGGTEVSQVINPAGQRISGLDVPLATYAAPADPAGQLVLTLSDPDDGQVLARTAVDGARLADGTWTSLTTDAPVEVGDLVVATLRWDGATPLALYANTTRRDDVLDGIRIRDGAGEALVNDPYPAGDLRVDGQPVPGDLAFRVRGAAGAGAWGGQLTEVAASAAARMADTPLFAILWVAALVGCGWLMSQARGPRGDQVVEQGGVEGP